MLPMESIITLQTTCKNCDTPVSGRRGKSFCSNECRTEFHNRQRSEQFYSPFVRTVTNTLLKNRRVLQGILANKESEKITKDKLIEQGFNFKYITNTFTKPGSNTYFYCFDFGYLPLDNDQYLIVKSKSSFSS